MIRLNDIKTNLRNAIRNSGLSQTHISNQLGVSQQVISQYLSGRALPALDTFANLCVLLDVDPADILGTNHG